MSTSKPPAKPPLRRLIGIVIVVWITSIPVADVVFRLLGERTTTDMAGLYQAFGEGGYRLRPNVLATADTLYGRYTVATNALGLRCARGARAAADSRSTPIDILVLGDSQAFGAGLSFEDTLVGQLAAKAGARGLRLENGAVGGHYLKNQFELARQLDDQGLRPRRVVLFLSPYLIFSAGQYNRVAVGSDGRLYAGYARRWTSWLKRNTVVYAKVRNAINRFYPLSADELVPMAVKIYMTQREEAYRKETIRLLEEFSRWADGRGIALEIVYTPLAVEIAFDPVRQAAQQSAAGEVDATAPFRAAQAAAAAIGVAMCDLRPALAEVYAQHHVVTLPADSHYDARASVACADRIWKTLFRGGTELSAAKASAALPAVLRSGSAKSYSRNVTAPHSMCLASGAAGGTKR